MGDPCFLELHHGNRVACFVSFTTNLSVFSDAYEQEGSRRDREFGAYVVDSLNNNEGRHHLLSPSQMPGMVLCVHSHVSWQQPYEVSPIVIPILH